MLFLGFLFLTFVICIGTLFYFSDQRSDLERYLSSKHVSTAADVDYWIRQYDKRHNA